MDTHEVAPMHLVTAAATETPDADQDQAVSRQVMEPLMALDFAVHTSLRYHGKRRAWFDRLHQVALGVIVLCASIATGALYGGLYHTATHLTLVVAIAAALDLFLGFAERARAEDGLFRRWSALAAEVAEAKTIDEGTLRVWDKRRLEIRADCEERLLVLHRLCYNLEAEARGFSDEALYLITAWQRLAAHLVSLPPHRPRRLPA